MTKKKVPERDIKLKDLKLGTRRGPLETPPTGDKIYIMHSISVAVFCQKPNFMFVEKTWIAHNSAENLLVIFDFQSTNNLKVNV